MSRDPPPVGDLVARALSRLATQLRGLPNTEAVAAAIGRQFQPIAQALLDLYFRRNNIEDSEGAQLDRIGAVVGPPRNGVTDSIYRLYLRARILTNKSSGAPDDLIRIFQAMFAPLAAAQQPEYIDGGNASFALQLWNPTTDTEAEVARLFVRDGKLAGVRALLLSQLLDDSAMFFTARATYITSAVSLGDGSIDVLDASAFPASGSIVVSSGTVDGEGLAYSSRSNISLQLVMPTAAGHPTGAAVTLVGSRGKGFPHATYVNAPAVPTDTAFSVLSSAGFAIDDVLTIAAGTTNAETFTVTGVGAGSISVTPAIAKAHVSGAVVVKKGSGGALARAHQA